MCRNQIFDIVASADKRPVVGESVDWRAVGDVASLRRALERRTVLLRLAPKHSKVFLANVAVPARQRTGFVTGADEFVAHGALKCLRQLLNGGVHANT